MKHHGVLPFLLFVLAGDAATPTLARAQDGGIELDLETAIRMAIERSPRVVVARAELMVAESYAVLGDQTRVRNPVVALRALVGQPDAPAATYSASVGIPFDLSQRRPTLAREAELVADRAQAELAAAINDARAEGGAAYVELSIATSLLAVAELRTEVHRGIVERLRAQLASAATTAYDLAMAERELGEAEAALAGVRARIDAARGALRQALDLDPLAVVRVGVLDHPSRPEVTLADAIGRAIRDRREPFALRTSAERFRVSERRYRAEAIDPFFVGAEFEAQGNQQTQRSIGASAVFSIPGLFTNPGDRAIARASGAAADIEADVVERTIAREVSVDYALLLARIEQLAILDASALPAAERAVELTEARLAAGSIDLFQLLANRRDLFELRAFRLEALREAWIARIALDRALGRDSSEEP